MSEDPVRTEQQSVSGYVKQRKVFQKTCAVCQTEFEGPTRQKYCGHTCAVRAWDASHAEERRQRQRDSYQRRKAEGKKT